MSKTRLNKIKDALVTEKNEEAAALAVGAATSDDPPDEAADEAIRCANPAKYAEHGFEYWQASTSRSSTTIVWLVHSSQPCYGTTFVTRFQVCPYSNHSQIISKPFIFSAIRL